MKYIIGAIVFILGLGFGSIFYLNIPKFSTDETNLNNTVWETENYGFLLHIQRNYRYDDGQISVKNYTCYPEAAKKVGENTIVFNDKETTMVEILINHYHFDPDSQAYELNCTFDDKYGRMHLETFYYQILDNGRMNFLWPIQWNIAEPLYNMKRVK